MPTDILREVLSLIFRRDGTALADPLLDAHFGGETWALPVIAGKMHGHCWHEFHDLNKNMRARGRIGRDASLVCKRWHDALRRLRPYASFVSFYGVVDWLRFWDSDSHAVLVSWCRAIDEDPGIWIWTKRWKNLMFKESLADDHVNYETKRKREEDMCPIKIAEAIDSARRKRQRRETFERTGLKLWWKDTQGPIK